MLILRWTGKGWLSLVIIMLSIVAGAIAGQRLGDAFPQVDGKNAGTVLISCVVLAILSPVHWIVGRALNSEPGPQGRVWYDEHTYSNAPMQNVAGAQAVLALALSSLVIGQIVSAWVGWAMFLGTIIGVLWARRRRRVSKQLRAVADRDRLAQANGWSYAPRDGVLALRWKESFGLKAAYKMGPFGVLAGELDGLPFTLFDTEDTRSRDIETVYVVHLPVAYPSVRVDVAPSPMPVVTPDQFDRVFSAAAGRGLDQDILDAVTERSRVHPERVHATPADSAFGRELLSPEVRAVTAEHRLIRWWIQGRDVICVVHSQAFSPTAENALAWIRTLIELVNAFPPDLAEHHGTPPTTDSPLRT